MHAPRQASCRSFFLLKTPVMNKHPDTMKTTALRLFAIALLVHSSFVIPLSAAAPGILNYQGRVAVSGLNFDGTGQFRFALVNAGATETYWTNDGTNTGTPGGAPTAAVSLTVTKGLYSLGLGDTALANMTAVPASVFADHSDVYLRVWFDDGTNGNVLLAPDQRITSVGYALNAARAESVADGAVGTAQLTDGAITSTKLASGAVTNSKIAAGAVDNAALAAGAVTGAKIATGAVGTDSLADYAVTTQKFSPNYQTGGGATAGVTGMNFTTTAGGASVAQGTRRTRNPTCPPTKFCS